eukprot:15437600-Alexandrium_andersonii.AAC.1
MPFARRRLPRAPGTRQRSWVVSDFRRPEAAEKAVRPVGLAGNTAPPGWILGPRLLRVAHNLCRAQLCLGLSIFGKKRRVCGVRHRA